MHRLYHSQSHSHIRNFLSERDGCIHWPNLFIHGPHLKDKSRSYLDKDFNKSQIIVFSKSICIMQQIRS